MRCERDLLVLLQLLHYRINIIIFTIIIDIIIIISPPHPWRMGDILA